jgi:sarcosine oxidase/L-pipecolate oxidase
LKLNGPSLTNITFADISKAFDTVWIKALILKLEKYGTKGNLLFWLKGYPSRRKQRVVIKDAISSTGELKADVPQGSVLGTLLFLYFIKDVADNMTGFGKLFADDTCIGHMAHNEENLHTLIRTDLEYSNTWSYRWLVKFNPNKTDTMIFRTRHLENNSIFDLAIFRYISCAYAYTFLCVIFSSDC